MGVGLGLKRARLENVYSVLRGRDAATDEVDPQKRDAQFDVLRKAQGNVLNNANWHHFLSALTLAGYRHEGMITSETAIIYTYVLYLVGIMDHGIDKQLMRQAIAEFFFMAALTGRYTNSPETAFEFDLAQLRGIKSGDEDKMGLHLVNLIRDRIGEIFLPYVHPHFEDEDGQRVLVIQCEKGPKPAFVKDGSIQRFYVRGANATAELSGNSVTDYVKAHFK